MQILMVTSEIAPLSKSGGLGDATAALSGALARRGHRVVTVSPRYGHLDARAVGADPTGVGFGIHAGGTTHHVDFLRRVDDDGVHHLLVDSPLFDRPGLYGDADGEYPDNHVRFAVLCRAALEAARRVPVGEGPVGEDAVVHAHDWQAALTPVFLEALYRPLGLFAWTPCVLTVHNLAHQGRFAAKRFADLDLAPRWFRPEGIEFYGDLNLLKGGLVTADRLSTVSPTFAREIQVPGQGFGLEGVLRHRSKQLAGILNGLDTGVWNPATDPHLAAHYGPDDLSGKARCKAALQDELGLPVDPEVPLVGVVGRLDPQKGVELLIEAIPWLVEEQEAQVAVLGSAQPVHQHYEEELKALQRRFPEHVRAFLGFSEALAHRIEAGADLFVMPSRFEPCGLNQLYSMRYGTPPVVRATGGLADSVRPASKDGARGTGWTFGPFEAQALVAALRQALVALREHPQAFRRVQLRGMGADLSWDSVVPRYEELYQEAIEARR